MKTITVLALSMAVAATACHADGILNVTSDVPAQVALDNQPAGDTPLSIEGVKSGNHEVSVTATATKETRSLMVYIPATLTIKKDVAVTFQPKVAEAPTYAQAPTPAPVVVAAPVYHHHHNHVRRRNIALGVTAVGVLTHSHILTGIGLGGALMNEIIGSGR